MDTAKRLIIPGDVTLPVMAFLLGATVAIFRAWAGAPVDFHLYWLAARHWSDPYNPALMQSDTARALFIPETLKLVRLPYYYPPTAMLLSWPMSRLPINMAFALFSGVNCAWLMWLGARRVGYLAVLLFFSLPMFYGAVIGQIGLAIACAAITAFELVETRPRLAGAILAAMVCIKPQSAIVAPFVLWGRWETVKAGVVVGCLLLLASLAFGPHRWIEWYQSMGRFNAEIEPIIPKIMPYLLFNGALWWRLVLIGAGVAFATWDRGLTGFLVGTLLCTPYFQLYDLAGFSFLGLLLVSEWRRMTPLKGLPLAMFGAALIVCPSYSETMLLFCAGLIGLRIVAHRHPVARSIAYAPPRTFRALRLSPSEASL